MTKILGLTGGIATGKSTVAQVFKAREVPVIDADVIAREVMEAGEPAVAEIRKAFGDAVILPDGEIDREKLGAMVFASDEKRERLNRIVHGDIRQRIQAQQEQLLKEGHPLIVLDIPLLFEGNYDEKVDEVMVVFVDQATQKERLLKRNPNLSEEEAEDRIQSQMPLAEKVERANIVIDNQGTVEETTKQVHAWLDQALQE